MADKKRRIFILRHSLIKWKEKYQSKFKQKKNEQISKDFHKKKLLTKYFKTWNNSKKFL